MVQGPPTLPLPRFRLLCEQEEGSVPPVEVADAFCPGSSSQTRNREMVLTAPLWTCSPWGLRSPESPSLRRPLELSEFQEAWRRIPGPWWCHTQLGTAAGAHRAPGRLRIFRLRPALLPDCRPQAADPAHKPQTADRRRGPSLDSRPPRLHPAPRRGGPFSHPVRPSHPPLRL